MEDIPFKAGQLAEARSFAAGYRGAWFRCKIREITKRKGTLGHISEYYDYPDEKVRWRKLYQVPPHCMGNAKEKHSELVLRPYYPPICDDKETPHVSELTVIVSGSWNLGDLVDWRNTGCYWSGRITELLNDHEAKIELPSPPLGQGSSYRVLLKDLRPSLDWSPEHGWTVPTQEGGNGHPCARLIKPYNQGQETEGVGSSARFSLRLPVSSNSGVSSELKSERMQKSSEDSSTRKTSGMDVDADSGQSRAEQTVGVGEKDLNCKKRRTLTLNSERSDTLEATIVDLEEYINKVKWLKKILKDGTDNFASEWEFVETPKI